MAKRGKDRVFVPYCPHHQRPNGDCRPDVPIYRSASDAINGLPLVPDRIPLAYFDPMNESIPLQRTYIPSSPSEDYLAVLAGQRQWIATTNFAGCPGQPQIALRIAPCSLPRQSS